MYEGYSFSMSLSALVCFFIFILVILLDAKLYLIVVLICTSLMMLSIYVFIVRLLSSVEITFQILGPFFNLLISFLMSSCKNILQFLELSFLSAI